MLDQFPKQRQALPEDYASIYLTLYSENRSGNSVLARVRKYLESWMHRQVSTKNTGSENLLEVGAGQLNHANYETNYQTYDVIEPLIQDWDSEVLRKVTSIYSSIFEIEAEKRYDRIFSIAVLEHIADLPYWLHILLTAFMKEVFFRLLFLVKVLGYGIYPVGLWLVLHSDLNTA